MRLPRLAAVAILLSCFAPLAGCVSMGRYNDVVTEANEAQAKEVDAEARATALAAEVESLRREVAARSQKLGESSLEYSNLKKGADDLVLMNAELSQRLKAAGQNVQELASERGNLSIALAETRKKLDAISRLEAQAEARAAEMRALAKSFSAMVDAGQLKVVLRDGRLVLEMPNDVLFDSAKTALKPAGKGAVVEVGHVLRGMKGRHFEVAGHTDDVAIDSQRFPSNWELSTARAVVVTKLLVEQGVDPKELSAAGYGEYAPISDNTSPEGRAKNRRIEIVLYPAVDEKLLAK